MSDEDSSGGTSGNHTGEAPPAHPVVVGIGASAGGLEALKRFFAHVPPDSGAAWVVVVHLAPDHDSHLAEVLQPHVRMPVHQVAASMALAPDTVYVIPPNANLSAVDTHLRLSALEASREARAPIDHFLRTLSQTHAGECAAVILSGTGRDGTLGIKEIASRGGLTIVQDPEEAEYDGMPRSAIATALVDQVLPLAEIPRAILDYVRTEPRVSTRAAREEPSRDDRQALQKIFAQIRARTGRDFSRYRASTMLRRIGRRMQLHRLEHLDDYLERLRTDGDEVRALVGDLLITVTSFFRDPEVFESLQQNVIPTLFRNRGPHEDLRVWSVGCATGEEAYSLGMLLLEEAQHHPAQPRTQIFATDLHEACLARAREGLYPGDIAQDVGEARLRRFFVEENGGYRVRPELRELVVFSPHDLLGDPPFSRLDLVCCRNLMIYLESDAQDDVLNLFHYALAPGGVLVLGTAESPRSGELFSVEDKKASIYRKRDVAVSEPRLPVFASARAAQPMPGAGAPKPAGVSHGAHQRLVERFAPPSLLVDPEDRVTHLSEPAGRYLTHPGGEPTTRVTRLVREELRAPLAGLLADVRERREPGRTQPLMVQFDGERLPVVIDARPATEPAEDGFVLVIFDQAPGPAAGQGVGPGAGREAGADAAGRREGAGLEELEGELDRTRERLRRLTEEKEADREEMRAPNEELQSANEELRSTMEELETSKAELQSMNEELQTLNQENRHKVAELAQLSADLQSLLTATDIATLFLDRELHIQRFTPRVSDLFSIRDLDRGRSILDLTRRLGYDELEEDATRVLQRLIPVEREIGDQEGRWYLTRVMPYRSREDQIAGVVLTFVDITGRRRAEQALRDAKEYAESIVETLHEPLLVLTPELRVKSANQAFFDHFQVDRSQTLGERIYELGNGQWNIPDLQRLLEEVLPDNQVFHDYLVHHRFEHIGERTMLLNARRVDHVQLILLGIRDVTASQRAEKDLRQRELEFRALVDASADVVYVMNADWSELQVIEGRGFLAETPTPTRRWLEAYIPEGDRPLVRRTIEEAIRTASVFELEHRVRRADGTVGWTASRAVPIADTDGEVTKWVGYAEDITERKAGEEALERRVAERTREVRELAATLSLAEQEERERLSHLLHDDLQQLLYGIQMKIALAQEYAEEQDAARSRAETERCLELLEEAIHRTRQLTVDLNPPLLKGEGLLEALEWLRTQMRDLHELEVEIHAEGDVEVPLPSLRILLFQITRELLFNIAKHAGTREARVDVAVAAGAVRVTVTDRGRGFDPAGLREHRHPRGLGLFSARERLRMHGGDLEIESHPGNGSRVTAYAPLASR